MRIIDWSSDVCSSDLVECQPHRIQHRLLTGDRIVEEHHAAFAGEKADGAAMLLDQCPEASVVALQQRDDLQIGRASCRERVCQYVKVWGGGVVYKNN